MTDQNLQIATTLELLIEVLYEGQAQGIVENLEQFEPIDLIKIFEVLEKRHFRCFSEQRIEDVLLWFNGSESPLSNEEKDIISTMTKFKFETDASFKKM